MTQPRFLQLDVFTEKHGGGNPLGVVLDADDWTGERMQAFAAWVNLVETTFVSAADDRCRQLPGAHFHAHARDPVRGPSHGRHCAHGARTRRGRGARRRPRAGVCCRAAARSRRTRRERSPAVRRGATRESAARGTRRFRAVGRARWCLARPPAARIRRRRTTLVARGARERSRLARMAAGPRRDRHARAREPEPGPVRVRARTRGSDYDVVVRAFPSGVGIIEDPASGAANGLLAAYIAHREPGGPSHAATA